MTQGFRLSFKTPPPLCLSPPPETCTSKRQEIAVSPFIPDWLNRGIIREITCPQPLFFSRMFSVPKKNGKVRPIIDLSALNKMLRVPSFKMETIKKVVQNVLGSLWGASVDITDAYLHVPIHWDFHKFFAFVLGGKIYVFQVLPFGLSPAPWAFSRVMKPIKSSLRVRGIIVFSFLDDFLTLAESPTRLSLHTDMLIQLLQRLGFKINWEKSSLIPQQRLEYLGVFLDLQALSLSLPQSKVESIVASCRALRAQAMDSRRSLECLIGHLNFAAPLFPLGRLYLLPIIRWMNSHTSPASRDLLVPLDQDLKSLLSPWLDPSLLSHPVLMHSPAPSLEIMTDASLFGWSGLLLPHRVEGVWSPDVAEFSMNWKELKAIHLSLLHFSKFIKGKSVKILSDNTTALACLRRQGSLRSLPLLDLSREILLLCQDIHVSLTPCHIKGVLNVLAKVRGTLRFLQSGP